MRLLGLSIGLALASAVAVGAAERTVEPLHVEGTVRTAPGSARVTLRDDAAAPFARAFGRLVVVPADADGFAVRVSDDAATVAIGRPMTLRGLRVVPLAISPVPGRAGRTLDLELTWRGNGEPEGAASALRSAGFLDGWGDLLLGAPPASDDVASPDGYLVVCSPELETGLTGFVDWKRETGHPVTVVTTDDTGTTNESIRAWIAAHYAAQADPPRYLLLVGDVAQIPGFDYHGSVSDLPYALVDGDDFLPDLETGRLSVQNAQQLATVLAKTLTYEQDPGAAGPYDWVGRGLVVGGNMGSSTPVPTSRWCREQLLDPAVGFTEVDSVYYPPVDAVGPYYIRPVIDEGVSIVSYRGWALGAAGWDAPQFTTTDIPSLSNGWKLPVVFSFVCLNGDYAEPECFGEGWIRAGTATEPKGAVAFLGNSEHWSHTRFNDAAAIGAFDAIRGRGVRRLGELLSAAKAQILEQFPGQVDFDPWGDESVEFYYHIYSLLGDPGLAVRTAAPRIVSVVAPDSLTAGATLLEIDVFEEDGSTPLPGARVGVARGDVVLGCARTDAAGRARIVASFEAGPDPVRLAVTGTGLVPHRGSFPVVEGPAYLAAESVDVADDAGAGGAGNGDGEANPGETLALTVSLRNRGGAVAATPTGTLEAVGGASVVAGAASWPSIAAGDLAASSAPFLVSIDPAAEDGLVARFRLETTAGADVSVSGFERTVRAPALRHEAHAVGGDGSLDPGETSSLHVTVRNEGSVPASAATAVLRTATPDLVTVVDSLATFDPVAIGLTTGTVNPFSVAVSDSAAIGAACVFTLETTTAEGWVGTTGFSVVVGAPDHRAPVGPDAYGYWAYDNSDTDYPDAAPVYDWTPVSPLYGGAGTALGLGDDETVALALPFPFVHYGVTYDSLLVSDNGWASFEIAPYEDFYNWGMPNAYGAGAQIAPFWDNLDPTKEHEGVPVGDGVYAWSDAAGHRFVVEWSRLGNVRSHHQDENRPDWDELQTFQLILLDPAFHPTPTGDGIVRFQYKQVVNDDFERMYATVGIENGAEDVGLEYTYSNLYPAGAAPLSAGLAIDFTTVPPRYRPFALARFEAGAVTDGVRLAWTPCDDRPRRGTRVYRADADGRFVLVPGGRLDADVRTFVDRSADPGSPAVYRIGSVDTAGREDVFGPFPYAGPAAPPRFALERTGPNPVAGPVELRCALPATGPARLRVYSVGGRLVRTLLDGRMDAGERTVTWDGRDDRARPVASGVYFVELEAAAGRRGLKIVRLR